MIKFSLLTWRKILYSIVAMGLFSTAAYGKSLPEDMFGLTPQEMNSMALKPFYKGLYGKIGSSTIFISKEAILPTKAEQYWAVVHVLSKKYGCFIRSKKKKKALTAFRCADGRVIVFHKRQVKSNIIFSARQFDLQGREMIVANGQVIRKEIPTNRLFPTMFKGS